MKECLNSLLIQTYQPDEVIIVDSSCAGETEAVCSGFAQSLNLEYIRSNPGLARQRHVGIAHAQGDALSFIDDDLLLEKDYLKNVRATLMRGYDGCTGCNTGARNSGIIKNVFLKSFMLVHWNGEGKIQLSGYPAYLSSPREKERIECCPGGVSSYRRKVFDRFQFNEGLPRDVGEDVDFSYRASKYFNFVYDSTIRCFHKVSPISRPNREIQFFAIVYFHHYFFGKYMPKSIINWLCFLWSDLGDLFRASYHSLRHGQSGPLIGYIKAHGASLKDLGHRQ